MEWTETTIARLFDLWHAKNPDGSATHSTAQIAVLMCGGKNAVIGKAHRLNFAARPSPIKHPKAEALAVTVEDAPLPVLMPQAKEVSPMLTPASFKLPPAPRPPPKPGRYGKCQFPLWGHVERVPRPPRFCERSTELNSPWCADCQKVVFTHKEAA